MLVKSWLRIVIAAVIALAVFPGAAGASPPPGRTPVVFFPGYGLTRLEVTVDGQTTAPGCPRSGSFGSWFANDHPSTEFSQVCQDRLLTLHYDPDPAKPMPARFSYPPGVDVRVAGYGRTDSAPAYEPLYRALEASGYRRDHDIRVAGYDPRLTPDLDGFLERTRRLVEDAYRENGDRPVHLAGHSNGPLYVQYLLTHTTRAWRDKYLHGFTSFAGNIPGQGLLYATMFTGLDIQDFGTPKTAENARSSALMYLSAPSTYMSAADPAVFGDREVVVQDTSTGRSYTPRDYPRLFADARLPMAKELADHYIGLVEFTGPRSFPGVDVFAEKGSGLPTTVGARLAGLTPGQVLDTKALLTRDGDGNQEDITNEAVLAWRSMPCHRFTLTDNPGVDHFALPGHRAALDRLITHLGQPRTTCREP
ncbi:hypothetical protein [Streptomyces sp. NPDC037389]|uniref:lipase/acyltransferase domain-containing protein n=1 Tax=Streptomyces sp. NPDC037389 TaxID=3155369 RepID=UPI0033C2C091